MPAIVQNMDRDTVTIIMVDSNLRCENILPSERAKAYQMKEDTMRSIMMEQKKPEVWNLTIPMDKIQKYFPRSYTPQRMEEVIFKLLDTW